MPRTGWFKTIVALTELRRLPALTPSPLLLGLLALACASPAVATDADRTPLDSKTDYSPPAFALATLRWNWEARDVVRRSRSDPLWAVRSYAMLSMAQHEAARLASAASSGAEDGPFVDLAVGSAAALTLAHLFPHELPRFAAIYQQQSQAVENAISPSEAKRARVIGEGAALKILRLRESDGAIDLELASPPIGPAAWYSSESWPSLRTYWGRVRPFIVQDISKFDAPPPPLPGTEGFKEALTAVRMARIENSAHGDALAKKWSDGPGTATPPGRWNKIATSLIARHAVGELGSARILAHLNMALADSSISCWRSKHQYWLLRPGQADQQIVPTYPLPNFPAYPSGHAAFSAAAATFLSHVFPQDREVLTRMAEEAAQSRVAGGIHYPFDAAAGLRQGREIAEAAIEWHRTAPATLLPAIAVLTKSQLDGGSR